MHPASLRFAALTLAGLISAASGDTEWHLSPEAQDLFAHARLEPENQYLFMTGGKDVKDLKIYVEGNWTELLEHADHLPVAESSSRREILGVIGQAAESLPAQDYMRFLDAYAGLYRRGQITAEELRSQLGGRNEKRFFLHVNWESAEVSSLIASLREILPQDHALNAELDDISSGEIRPSMFEDENCELHRVETLPGVKLPERITKVLDERDQHLAQIERRKNREETDLAMNVPPALGAGETSSHNALWILATAGVLGVVAWLISKVRKRGSLRR